VIGKPGHRLYYSFAWPVFSRLFPEYSADQRYEQWAEHVYQFTLGGIEAIKKQGTQKAR
jgi:TetR/AcrR family transcriptional regulator, regulator of cefoperazone and chloramphenicol sensitivity